MHLFYFPSDGVRLAGTIHRMPSANFDTAIARVDRAVGHREELWTTAAAHLDEHPISREFDIRSDEVRSTVRATAPFPASISISFGEWLYNLRAALDALLYELAVEDTQLDPPTHERRRQYPIIEQQEKFDKDSKQALADLTEWTVKGIEGTQPYHIETGHLGHGLWWLHELARLDRHRRHHLFQWRVVGLQADANPAKFVREGTRVCDPDATFLTEQEPLELVAYRRRGGTALADRDVSIEYTVQPDIPEWVTRAVPGFGVNSQLGQRMVTVEECVRCTIKLFRDHLPQRTPWNGELVNIDM